jgi:hypothetical protein
MSELEIGRTYKRGDKGVVVKRIQEWLCLQGYGVVIDKDFGAATEEAVTRFQKSAGRKRVDALGEVGPQTYAALVGPMLRALSPIAPDGKTRGKLVAAYAAQHLAEHPREVGGENCGPWVRLYLDGNEGDEWAWCAGFACFLLKQACESLGAALPLEPSYSCTELARRAKAAGVFLAGTGKSDPQIRPGAFFLVRKSTKAWVHIGIVTSTADETFDTIEGNTNDEGSAEGYEVCARTRGWKNRDFILL